MNATTPPTTATLHKHPSTQRSGPSKWPNHSTGSPPDPPPTTAPPLQHAGAEQSSHHRPSPPPLRTRRKTVALAAADARIVTFEQETAVRPCPVPLIVHSGTRYAFAPDPRLGAAPIPGPLWHALSDADCRCRRVRPSYGMRGPSSRHRSGGSQPSFLHQVILRWQAVGRRSVRRRHEVIPPRSIAR